MKTGLLNIFQPSFLHSFLFKGESKGSKSKVVTSVETVPNLKASTQKGIYVWSPAGESNAALYWPGENNVDYIGLSLYIYDQFEKDTYNKIRSFDESFDERYKRVFKFNKPIMIAELGVNTNQQAWMYNAQKNFYKYTLLKTIIYFNAKDTAGVWGKYSTPDWSIDPEIFPKTK